MDNIKLFLLILEIIGYIRALYELFVKKSITLGLLMALAPLILNISSWVVKHKTEIQGKIANTTWRMEKDAMVKLTYIITGIYIFLEIICLYLANSYEEYMDLFWEVFIVYPIIYSVIGIVLRVFSTKPLDEYAAIQSILSMLPIVFGFVILLFDDVGILLKLFGFIVLTLFFVLVGAISTFAGKIMSK